MVINLPKLFLFFSFVFFYSPRFSFFQLPGSTSDIRLDVLMFFIVIFIILVMSLKYLSSLKLNLALSQIVIIFTFLGLLFILRNGPLIYALFQLIWYGSIIFFFIYGKKIIELNLYPNVVSYLRIFINLNMISHLLFWVFNFAGLKLQAGQVSMIYGVFNMPYGFGLMIGIYGLTAISNYFRISLFEKILILISIILCDSRVALGGFIIGLFIITPSHKKLYFAAGAGLILVLLFSYFSVTELRAVNILFYSLTDIISDPSLNVRLSNYYRYLEWVTINDFLLGYGPLSYMEYSIQYGKPGPLDVFYFRIFSDFGLLTSSILLITLLIYCIKNIKIFFKENNILLALTSFLILYSFFNEGLLVIKLGHIIALIVGLIFWRNKIILNLNKNNE